MVATNGANRQHKAADYTDYAHTGPGTLAGRYLRRFWQPVALSRDLLPGYAKPIKVMSEDFTLYRGEDGTAHVVAFRCAHRGTQLSTGWVEGNCIRCFYHGWKYDGTGQCVEMPAEDPSFPPKVRIKSYPTEEYLGLIFAYLGEDEAPPLRRFPEFEADGLLETVHYERPCNYFQNVENVVDEVHVAFVHRESEFTAGGLNWDLPEISAEETEYGLVEYGRRANGVVRVTCLLMPNSLLLRIPPENSAETDWRDLLAWRVPIDDVSHRGYLVQFVHVTGDDARRYQEAAAVRRAEVAALPSAVGIARAVLAGQLRTQDVLDRPDVVGIQDYVAQAGQGAIADRRHERLGQEDVAILLLRKLWQRELRALAEGRPLKQWTRPDRLVSTSGV
jgi:5,5'-dehydrodivanillate O-demethylase